MKAYRIDEYLGAVTECKAVFFEKHDAKQYVKIYPYNNLGIIEIEIPESTFNSLFVEEHGTIH